MWESYNTSLTTSYTFYVLLQDRESHWMLFISKNISIDFPDLRSLYAQMQKQTLLFVGNICWTGL